MTNLTQPLKVIVLAIVLSFGISYVFAWAPPTQAPTGGNDSMAPLNTSNNDQTKNGNLFLNALGITNITAGALSVAGGAVFGGGVKANKLETVGGGLHISGIQGAPSQGVAIGWNHNRGSGATWLINNAGWGLGGFNFDNVKNGVQTRLMTLTAAPGAKLDVNGNIKIGNSSASCTASHSGEIRFTASKFWGCNGTIWVELGGSTPAPAPAPAPACSNACSPSGARSCNGSQTRTCGNYDADSCLEWSAGTNCTYGCSGAGNCNLPPPPPPTTCTWGSRTYSNGTICYSGVASCFVTGTRSGTQQHCSNGSWVSNSIMCTYSSLAPNC